MPTVTFDFRARGADAVRRSMQQVLDGAARSGAAPARQAQQEQASTRATLREIAIRQRAAERAARDIARTEKSAAAATARETNKRLNADAAASRARSREVIRWAEAVERSEQRATRATERGAERRRAADARANAARRESFGRAGGRAGTQVFGAVMGAAGTVHGQIQDARQRGAQTERTAGLAFFQAGATSRSEIAARIAQTRAFAQANGMTSDELLSGANAAQTEFSSLQGGTETERQSRFTNMLSTMLLARNTGNDAGEFARLQGMLAQSGFDPALQRQTLLYTAGATQQGAVEAGSMTREGMGAIMRRMQDRMGALGVGATSDQRNQAAAEGFREMVAELQVFRGRGNRVGISGNATASMQEALRGTSRQDKILNNIAVARGATTDRTRQQQFDQLRDQLFEADPTRARGSRRLRSEMQNPLALAATYAGVMGNDATGLLNLTAGGGHVNPQSLQANWRNLLSQLVATDSEGVTGFQRVKRLQNPNVALTEARVAQGASIFGQDSLSELNRDNEARDAALLMDTAAKRFSDAVARFAAQNPFASPAASAAASGAGGMLSGAMGRLIGQSASTSTAFSALSTAASAAGTALASAGAVAGAAFAGLMVGDAISGRLQAAMTGTNAPSNGIGRGGGTQDTRRDSVFSMDTWRELPSAIVQALSSRPSPQVADHSSTLGRTLLAAERNRL